VWVAITRSSSVGMTATAVPLLRPLISGAPELFAVSSI
jgi:hypothetical protein